MEEQGEMDLPFVSILSSIDRMDHDDLVRTSYSGSSFAWTNSPLLSGGCFQPAAPKVYENISEGFRTNSGHALMHPEDDMAVVGLSLARRA